MNSIFIEPVFTDLYSKNPLVLVDIGASGGLASNWKAASKYLKMIGFEPDEREFVNLMKQNDQRKLYLNTALYNKPQEINFFMNRKQQTSSVFEPNRSFLDQFPESDRFDVMKVARMKTDTLDRQFELNHITQADFIKVDTDGSELFVLQGASHVLDRDILGIEVEVEYAPMHLGQPQFCDVDKFIQSKGFHLFDLKNYFWKRQNGKTIGKSRGQIIFADALYFKTMESLDAMMKAISDVSLRKAKVVKMISICALYGYLDYANQVFIQFENLFSPVEKAIVEKWLLKGQGWYARIPNFPGRRKLSKVFYCMWDVLKSTHNGWATIERELGNR